MTASQGFGQRGVSPPTKQKADLSAVKPFADEKPRLADHPFTKALPIGGGIIGCFLLVVWFVGSGATPKIEIPGADKINPGLLTKPTTIPYYGDTAIYTAFSVSKMADESVTVLSLQHYPDMEGFEEDTFKCQQRLVWEGKSGDTLASMKTAPGAKWAPILAGSRVEAIGTFACKAAGQQLWSGGL